MRILLIDNFDSFTHNLAHALAAARFEGIAKAPEVLVRRADAITIADLSTLAPDLVVISPGPGRPEDAHTTPAIVRHILTTGSHPLLGVCLGMQSIVLESGGRIVPARRLMHGKTSTITHDNQGLFAGLPSPLEVARYHSLAIDEPSLPRELVITARADDHEIMAIRHTKLPIEAVQFHPESFMTPLGPILVENALRLAHHAQAR
ncbi:MAG: aminodeoxychorismate/anthranilate synthase component II [Phycisphaerales bacterium]